MMGAPDAKRRPAWEGQDGAPNSIDKEHHTNKGARPLDCRCHCARCKPGTWTEPTAGTTRSENITALSARVATLERRLRVGTDRVLGYPASYEAMVASGLNPLTGEPVGDAP